MAIKWKKYVRPLAIGLIVSSFTGWVATYVKMVPLIGGIGIVTLAISGGILVALTDFVLQKAKIQ